MGTFRWGSCMLSCMLRVHQAIYFSILFPSHWRSSAGYFWFVYWMSLFDRRFVGGREWQYCAWPITPLGSFGRSCQWSVTLRHLWPFLEFQTGGKMTSWNIFRACLASAALHGKASTHLDTYSTATSMCSQSWDFGNGPMKLMPQTSNSLTWRLFVRGIALRVVIPPCIWHLRHLRMNSLVSSYIVGQKKPLC